MNLKTGAKVSRGSISLLTMACCLALVAVMSALLRAESVVLVSAGQSRFHISLPTKASVCEKFAAEELSKYIKQIAGVSLKIQEETEALANSVRIAGGREELDGYRITVTPDQILLQGTTERAALYAVYQLLKDMGCRWFYIGSLGEVVPERDTIELSLGQKTENASFPERSVMLAYAHYYNQFDQWIDLCGKFKINNICIYGQPKQWWLTEGKDHLGEIAKRGIILEWGGHLMPSLVPRELFQEHPEYFRLDPSGQRNAEQNFCPRSEGINILRKNFREYLKNMDDFRYFHIWADDIMGGGWCNCPQCRGFSPAEQNLLAVNALAEILSLERPESFVANLAYHDTLTPVQKIRPQQNIFLMHAPRERCYAHAINDPGCRRNREEYLPQWRGQYSLFGGKNSNTIHCFEYYTDAILDRQMQPPQINVIPSDARYYRDLAVSVFQNLIVAFRNWHSPPLSLLIFAEAAWNADIAGEAVLEDFCRCYYGEKLAPLMADYYRQVEQSMNLFFESDAVQGPYLDMTLLPLDEKTNEIIIPRHRQAVKTHRQLAPRLSAALKDTGEGILAERLRRELEVCELHDLILLMSATQHEGHFLTSQFLQGKIDKAQGKRALDILNQCLETINNVNKWIEQFPQEQKLWISGWQNYHDKFFADLIRADRVKVEKQINDNAGKNR